MSDRSQITFYTLHITARRALGYHPQVILAGRAINDHMPKHVAQIAVPVVAINACGQRGNYLYFRKHYVYC